MRTDEHMGRGAVRCESGCECEGAALEGHSVAHASQEGVAVLHVTQALLCHLRFEVEDATLSGDHKVKLLGITVEPGK